MCLCDEALNFEPTVWTLLYNLEGDMPIEGLQIIELEQISGGSDDFWRVIFGHPPPPPPPPPVIPSVESL